MDETQQTEQTETAQAQEPVEATTSPLPVTDYKAVAVGAIARVIACAKAEYAGLPAVPGNAYLGETRGCLDNILLQLLHDEATIGGH